MAMRVPNVTRMIKTAVVVCAAGAAYGVNALRASGWKPTDSSLFFPLSKEGRYDAEALRQHPDYVGTAQGSAKDYPSRMVWGVPCGKILPTNVDEIAADDPRRIETEADRVDSRSPAALIASGAQGFAPFGGLRDINAHVEAGIGGVNKETMTGLVSWRAHLGGSPYSDGPENVKEMLASAGHKVFYCYRANKLGPASTFVAADSQDWWYRLWDNERELVTPQTVSLEEISQVEIFHVEKERVASSRTIIRSPFKPTYLHVQDFSSEHTESVFTGKNNPVFLNDV